MSKLTTNAVPQASNTLLLRRQLTELTKRPVEGFSAGLADDSNLYEWEILIIGPPDTIYEGGFFKARLSFPYEYPLLPPKMRFITPMWHPNIYPDGLVCISILHAPGDDQYGYEDAGERWMPVHSVESILLSVISLLSSEKPNLDSPANVDAAKEIRTDFECYKKKSYAYVTLSTAPCLSYQSIYRVTSWDRRHAFAGARILAPQRSATPHGPCRGGEDWDSDFQPGPHTYDTSKKEKHKPKVRKTRRTCRREVLGFENAQGRKKRVRRTRTDEGPNPLLQYFGEDLDLHSASEGEHSDVPQMDEDNEDAECESDEGQKEPFISKTLEAFFPQRGITPIAKSGAAEDGSVTESDSDVEYVSKRKHTPGENGRPRKKTRQSNSGDDNESSVTESDDSEMDLDPVSVPAKETNQGQDDSETQSESETELLANPRLKPKPGFPLVPGQRHLGPFLLDTNQKRTVPAAINTYLREYQRDGVMFLWKQYREGRGGLLGDDMGQVFFLTFADTVLILYAGKTIQVIAFLSAIMEKSGVQTDRNRRRKHVSKLQDEEAWKKRRVLPPADAAWPTCLLIAPSTVVHNWEREFETWGYFEVDGAFGLLTSFDIARKDIDVLDNLAWSCIFVDEVHRVKNETAKVTQAYHQFRCRRRFGLTGTTIQNSYKEMWTILDWTNPGQLGSSRQWQGFVVKPLIAGQSASATEEERAKALAVALVLRDKLLPRFFLRRTKDIIRDQLPRKIDQVKCALSMRFGQKTCCHPFIPGDVFKFMSALIKLSNHLGLILPAPIDSPEQTIRNRALSEIAFPDGDIPKYGTAMMQLQYCGKWVVLDLLLKEWRKDPSNKVLLFTKSVKLLEMLEFHLHAQGYDFLKLDGSTKQSERMPMIDRFHTDPDIFIFLISTLAGGTGLNLTGANKVVIFDPNWNPAHDLQAMDRAFRFGQTRDVFVYRLLGAGSIEELIYARQIYKQQQMAIGYDASVQTRYFEGIQGDAAKKGELFGIENIFKLHEDKMATKMAIEKANLAELDWALANMKTVRSKKRDNITDELITDADGKAVKEDSNMKGLGALLFDDAVPDMQTGDQDAIQKTLNAIGITYSHINEELLQPSRIEEERTKNTLRARRKSKQSSSTKTPRSPVPQWPPKRKHHKPPPTPEEQLASRYEALMQLGMISSRDDIPEFARGFARKSLDEQRDIIARLDEWTRSGMQKS
ncbi:hypothetical protein APHAL10511_002438 [Amanita phalloides]|nr:hypothetical protein APHAL10511_002438 [Amanita phalloides]